MAYYGKRKIRDWWASGESTEIFAFGKALPGINTPDQYRQEGTRPYAQVILKHANEQPNWEYEHSNKVDLSNKDNPTELFKHTPATISELYSDPSMTHHVGNILGAAVNEHRKRENRPESMPLPSADLSKHSSKMIQNARSKGVKIPINPSNPNSVSTNAISFENYNMSPNELEDSGIKPMENSDRQAGKATFRELLRGPKPSKVSPQQFNEHYDQGKLF